MEFGTSFIVYAMAALLLVAGVYMLVTGKNPFRPKREGALASMDRKAARVDGIISTTAAVGLAVSVLSNNNQLATGLVLVAGFALAFVLGKTNVL